MLQVNLDTSDREVERSIMEICGVLGRVKSVKVHRTPSDFALIEMALREHTYELTARFGGSAFGTCALIHLSRDSE